MNKNILIIGSSGQIGISIAKKLASENYNLGLHYNKNNKILNQEFFKNKNVQYLKMNFYNKNSAINLIKKFIKKFKRIDGLIIASGYIGWKKIENLDVDDFKKTFLINSIIPFFLIYNSIKLMRPKSKIMVISSISAKYFGSDKSLDYSSSKNALEGIVMSLNKICLKKKISINIIRPGFIDNNLQKRGRSRREISKRINAIPFKKAVNSLEIADLVSFLLSEKVSSITGENITIAGGE